MSVVVRMEMPSYCGDCKLKIWDRWLDGGNYRCVKTMCKITGHMKNGTKPNDCPIICSLPEGHGRLVDKDEMLKKIENYHRYMTVGRESDPRCIIEDAPTIVPADAPDAVTPTDTPTDTPTVPAERSEE